MLQESTDWEGNLLLASPWLLEGYREPRAVSGPHLCATATCMRGDTNRGPKVSSRLTLLKHYQQCFSEGACWREDSHVLTQSMQNDTSCPEGYHPVWQLAYIIA